jgi:hypothetical protein
MEVGLVALTEYGNKWQEVTCTAPLYLEKQPLGLAFTLLYWIMRLFPLDVNA